MVKMRSVLYIAGMMVLCPAYGLTSDKQGGPSYLELQEQVRAQAEVINDWERQKRDVRRNVRLAEERKREEWKVKHSDTYEQIKKRIKGELEQKYMEKKAAKDAKQEFERKHGIKKGKRKPLVDWDYYKKRY